MADDVSALGIEIGADELRMIQVVRGEARASVAGYAGLTRRSEGAIADYVTQLVDALGPPRDAPMAIVALDPADADVAVTRLTELGFSDVRVDDHGEARARAIGGGLADDGFADCPIPQGLLDAHDTLDLDGLAAAAGAALAGVLPAAEPDPAPVVWTPDSVESDQVAEPDAVDADTDIDVDTHGDGVGEGTTDGDGDVGIAEAGLLAAAVPAAAMAVGDDEVSDESIADDRAVDGAPLADDAVEVVDRPDPAYPAYPADDDDAADRGEVSPEPLDAGIDAEEEARAVRPFFMALSLLALVGLGLLGFLVFGGDDADNDAVSTALDASAAAGAAADGSEADRSESDRAATSESTSDGDGTSASTTDSSGNGGDNDGAGGDGDGPSSDTDADSEDADRVVDAEPTTEPEPTAEPTATPPPEPEPTPEPTATPTPEPTATPEPTPTPAPTADPLEGLPPLSELPERGAVFVAAEQKLYLRGPVTEEEGVQLEARAIEVLGPDRVVNDYVYRPDAPPVTEGTVRVEQAVLFQTGSAVIANQFVPTLELGVIVMTLNPQVTMIVEGHTDDVGTDETNQRLSEDRAASVVAYLVGRGIDRDRLVPVGFGESEPIAPNDTPEGRQLNRRIEVDLVDLLAERPDDDS